MLTDVCSSEEHLDLMKNDLRKMTEIVFRSAGEELTKARSRHSGGGGVTGGGRALVGGLGEGHMGGGAYGGRWGGLGGSFNPHLHRPRPQGPSSSSLL